MWDKKGENLTYKFLRLLKEQMSVDPGMSVNPAMSAPQRTMASPQDLKVARKNIDQQVKKISVTPAQGKQAVKMAQSVVGDIIYADADKQQRKLAVDGIIGPLTLTALTAVGIPKELIGDNPRDRNNHALALRNINQIRQVLSKKYDAALPHIGVDQQKSIAAAKNTKVTGIKPAPVPAKRKVTRFSGKMSDEIKERNMKYFGNPDGLPGNGWQSSLEDKRYNHRLNYIFGPIPYRGTTEGKPSNCELHPDWKKDNLKRVSTSIGRFTAHKQVADKMAAAIEECRETYGLPLRLNGAYYKKGTSRGFSTHAWGCAVDLDPYTLNPFTKDGNLSLAQTKAARAGKAGTRPYWQFKNSEGVTWKEYLDNLGPSEKAMPLYVFVAGPRNNNGMAKIFAKHGFPSWGGNWRGSKDNLHFSVFG